MTVTGSSPIVRNPGTGAAASWRGIILWKSEFDSWQTIPAGSGAACIFDLAPYDSDNFLSTGPLTFGPTTVPTGSAAVVPVGLSGLYRVSSATAVGIPADPDGYTFGTLIAKNGSGEYAELRSSDNVDGIGYSAVISPGLYRLAEGDAVWVSLTNTSDNADIEVISLSWLLVEYLMPWPEDET